MASQQQGRGTFPPVTAPETGTPSATPDPDRGNGAAIDALRGHDAYTDAFGDTVGGFLHGLVRDNLSPDKVDGYALDGVRAGTGVLTEWMMDHVGDDQRDEAATVTGALRTHLDTTLGGAIVDSDLGETVSDFALDHPWATTGAALLGAAGYVLSDQPLDDLDTRIKLAEGNHLLLGGDFGTTLDPSVEALRLGYRYAGPHRSFEGMAESDLDGNAFALTGTYNQRLSNGGSLTLDGAYHREDDRHLATGGLSYRDEDVNAWLKGSYDSADGGLGALNAGFTTLGEGPRWQGGLDANTNGAWNAHLGVSHQDEARNLEWFARVHGGQDEAGETDYGVRAGLNWRF